MQSKKEMMFKAIHHPFASHLRSLPQKSLHSQVGHSLQISLQKTKGKDLFLLMEMYLLSNRNLKFQTAFACICKYKCFPENEQELYLNVHIFHFADFPGKKGIYHPYKQNA